MTPRRHKNRLMKLLESLKNEVCSILEDEHTQYPYKNLDEVEHDIDDLIKEVERKELV